MNGTCLVVWYVFTQEVQQFARYSLVAMALDTILSIGCLLNLRAILRLEQHADALSLVVAERSDMVPMVSI